MNFFSDERAAELRDLFFESAQDLLQELNEAGILLETDPADSDALARVRRAMHTLKGDSAACGFRQLSELAHELEDLLTPTLVIERGEVVAEIVLSAADSFHAMLGAPSRQPSVSRHHRTPCAHSLAGRESKVRVRLPAIAFPT